MGIYGAGKSHTNKWIPKSFHRWTIKLQPNQQIGLDHYEDLNSRIPRDEVTAWGAYGAEEAAKLPTADTTAVPLLQMWYLYVARSQLIAFSLDRLFETTPPRTIDP